MLSIATPGGRCSNVCCVFRIRRCRVPHHRTPHICDASTVRHPFEHPFRSAFGRPLCCIYFPCCPCIPDPGGLGLVNAVPTPCHCCGLHWGVLHRLGGMLAIDQSLRTPAKSPKRQARCGREDPREGKPKPRRGQNRPQMGQTRTPERAEQTPERANQDPGEGRTDPGEGKPGPRRGQTRTPDRAKQTPERAECSPQWRVYQCCKSAGQNCPATSRDFNHVHLPCRFETISLCLHRSLV